MDNMYRIDGIGKRMVTLLSVDVWYLFTRHVVDRPHHKTRPRKQPIAMGPSHRMLKGMILCNALLMGTGFVLYRTGNLELIGIGRELKAATVTPFPGEADSAEVPLVPVWFVDSVQGERSVGLETYIVRYLDILVGRIDPDGGEARFDLQRTTDVLDSLHVQDSINRDRELFLAASSKSMVIVDSPEEKIDLPDPAGRLRVVLDSLFAPDPDRSDSSRHERSTW